MVEVPQTQYSPPVANTPAVPDSYVDWGAIIGGALIAVILSFILFTFGSALGLSVTSIEPDEGISLRWLAIAGGIWLIWTMVTSSAAGGYFAGRMRKPVGDANDDEVEARDGAHGLVSWAVAGLLTLALAATGVGNSLSGVAAGASSVLGKSADGIGSLIEKNSGEMASLVLRNQNALPSEAARKEITSIMMSSIERGEVVEADRMYLAQVVARETNLDANEARARVDQAIAQAEQARDKAIDVAEQARIFSVIGGFILAASLLASAAAAYFAAVMGGEHRNSNMGFGNTRTFWQSRRAKAARATDSATMQERSDLHQPSRGGR